ncbi:DUF2334 domain-containing protein [Corynebacterium sp. CCM 9185]|uniref:DUF2334 domain-containing protein n=1 Tax=Corynebacterium marambiense TaxID=2765364 RepID=A0ABS0VZQ3_9CORY|nr:DUF2334 domain-containing protein [Corynebacterium marambiense]MBI9001115.1 DUF2334 domain-containing protein [Corynebacterium marambiense]MCK7664356.1 DUF2334 domain-containing protein [Corynebacterium marambiense]MCX7543169.1 DUF2334 domain-containing protein [Corynebacterium marambiense]
MTDMNRPLLSLSLSSLRSENLEYARALMSELTPHGVRPALRVAPHCSRDWALRRHPDVLEFIHGCREAGAEIVLAGFDESVRGRRSEFAELPAHEARLRLTAACRQMAAMDLTTDVFSPPKWILSDGTRSVLPELGFTVLSDLNGVQDLRTGAVAAVPVLAFGEGFGAARWWRRSVRKVGARQINTGHSIRLSTAACRVAEDAVRDSLLSVVYAALDAGYTPANRISDVLADGSMI